MFYSACLIKNLLNSKEFYLVFLFRPSATLSCRTPYVYCSQGGGQERAGSSCLTAKQHLPVQISLGCNSSKILSLCSVLSLSLGGAQDFINAELGRDFCPAPQKNKIIKTLKITNLRFQGGVHELKISTERSSVLMGHYPRPPDLLGPFALYTFASVFLQMFAVLLFSGRSTGTEDTSARACVGQS